MSTGKDAEFTALAQRQSRFALRVDYAVPVSAADAEDAVQEAWSLTGECKPPERGAARLS